MVFNFRRRKNKKDSTSQEASEENITSKKNISNRRRIRKSKKAKNKEVKPLDEKKNDSEKVKRRSSRHKPQEFRTPLGTIEEGKDEVEGQNTGGTAMIESSPEETPNFPLIHVLNSGTGEAEMVVVEDLFSMASSPDLDSSNGVKKQLFVEEEPFDAIQAMRPEDPHILEVEKSLTTNDEEREEMEDGRYRKFTRQLEDDNIESPFNQKRNGVFDAYTTNPGRRVDSIAKNIINAFSCSEDTSLFDTVCADTSMTTKNRVFFNDVFAYRFIQETMLEGIPMLYHHPPSNPVDNDWTGQSMNMFLCRGNCTERKMSQPRLEWRTLDGGWSRLNEAAKTTTISVSLMDIHSMMDKVEDDEDTKEDDEFCFFSITTTSGDVHLLECADEQERDRVVTGIRNVLWCMSNSLISGDDTVTRELYRYNTKHEEEGGDFPLRNNIQSLKAVSHNFLDSLGVGIADT